MQLTTPQFAAHLDLQIGTGQDCAAAGYSCVTYIRRKGSPTIIGRIGRRDQRWHVVLSGYGETTVATTHQAAAWINRRA